MRLIWMFAIVSVVSAQPRLDPAKLVDLTYNYDENTIYWPTAKPFQFEKESWGISKGGYWYSAGRYAASEHGGTHFDAPIHFAEGKATVEQIPVKDLVAPAIVIDIAARCNGNPDYLLTAADIQSWERAHGRIPAGVAALVHTGWGRFWPNKKTYLGTDKPGDVPGLRFPGIGTDAAKLLAARKVRAIGIDTASIDYGRSTEFMTHRVLYASDIYGLENVANLEKLPATGATLISLPMKIKGGSGAPARLVALLP
jgi:kynurenine formamidase